MASRQPRFLELFSGTGSVGKGASRPGFEVVPVDIDASNNPNICVDIHNWDARPYGIFDWIHASPPRQVRNP